MKIIGFHRIKARSIRSSALGYAISFLLLVGLICSGVLFISSVNKRLEHHYAIEEHLIFDNYFALLYGAKTKKAGSFLLPHPSGDTSSITVKPWGAFKVVAVKTFHGSRSEERSAIIGDQIADKGFSIYLPDNNQSLKLCGDTHIEGKVSLPERGVEKAYIAGKNYTGDQLIYGTKARSDRSLPHLKPGVRNITLETFYNDLQKIEWTAKDSSYSYHNKTSLITGIEPLIIDQKISGNIILHSFDSIYVKSTAKLENVILIAPKIRFEKGFRGCVQAIAHEQLICEEDVFLAYPSILILNEIIKPLPGQNSEIVLNEGAKVLGGVLLVSQNADFRIPVRLRMQNSLIAGTIYNQGESEIIGTVAGSIYTQQFYLKAGGGVYINHLMDAKISTDLLHDDFVAPQRVVSDDKKRPILLACF